MRKTAPKFPVRRLTDKKKTDTDTSRFFKDREASQRQIAVFQGQEKLRQRYFAHRKSAILFQGEKHSLNEVPFYLIRSAAVCTSAT
jgi:hypothetical protein